MTDDIKSLMQQVWALDRSPLRLELLERVVALADSSGDISQAYHLRQLLIDEATFGGSPDKLLAAFSWCLGQCDRDPEQFNDAGLLWKYKWAVANLRDYPQISRAQFDATIEDMAGRFRKHGASMRTIYHRKCMMAVAFGDEAMLGENLPHWKKHRRDQLSDCHACEKDGEVDVLAFQGDYAGAVKAAESLVRGRMSCAEIPHKTYAKMLLPLIRQGQWERAAECHSTGYPKVRGTSNFNFMEDISHHLIYLAIVGDRTKSIKAFERHMRQGFTAPSPLDRYFFARAATLVLRRAAAAVGKPTRKLRMPEEYPHREESGQYVLTDLAGWFETEARGLAVQFDTRAGNTYRVGQMDALSELEELAQTAPKKSGESDS
jgi:hypothetical protein